MAGIGCEVASHLYASGVRSGHIAACGFIDLNVRFKLTESIASLGNFCFASRSSAQVRNNVYNDSQAKRWRQRKV